MQTHKISVVLNERLEQHRIGLPKQYCRTVHLQKKDKILLINNERYPYFFVLIPEMLYDRLPHLRQQIEAFIQRVGGETP